MSPEPKPGRWVICGLTGGIASGKSTVARLLAGWGVHIIDADMIAHQVVQSGRQAFSEVVQRFGSGVLGPDGELDRQRLAAIVFAEPAARRDLERIIHPRVRRRMADQLQRLREFHSGGIAVLDIPLLFETGAAPPLDLVLVVYIPEALQLQRLMARDDIGAGEAKRRLRAQMSIETKRRLADLVIDNSGTHADTVTATRAVYEQLAERACRR